MAKNRLDVSYDFEFDLIAINSNVKEYKLAWAINKNTGLELAKEENISIDFSGGKSLAISNYFYKTEYQVFRLLKNKAENLEEKFNAFLIPELKHFDYFLMVADDSMTFQVNPFISTIKEIPFVQFAVSVDTSALKSKDNLIF
ncbi:MAG: IPExxxVDY family protein [Roseivirga sp.]|nr:IPExxxVDY family protein [Roseivirga sp.]